MLTFEQQRKLTPEQAASYFELLMRRPVKRLPSMDDETYLDGDYTRVGSYKSTRWGR
jgi:hypothetical protein